MSTLRNLDARLRRVEAQSIVGLAQPISELGRVIEELIKSLRPDFQQQVRLEISRIVSSGARPWPLSGLLKAVIEHAMIAVEDVRVPRHIAQAVASTMIDHPSAFMTCGCDRCFTPIPIDCAFGIAGAAMSTLFERCPSCGADL